MRELLRFVGMAQLCRRFIKDLKLNLAPLYNLIKALAEFSWSQECQIDFARVKSLLTEPSDTSDFILETGASDVAIWLLFKNFR